MQNTLPLGALPTKSESRGARYAIAGLVVAALLCALALAFIPSTRTCDHDGTGWGACLKDPLRQRSSNGSS